VTKPVTDAAAFALLLFYPTFVHAQWSSPSIFPVGVGSTSAYVYRVQLDTTPPTVPINLTAQAISTSQIDLAWTASTDDSGTVAGYEVERCQGTGCSTFFKIATLGMVTSYNDTGLAAATSYTYRVRAFDPSGNRSNNSTPTSATTFDTTPPTAPSNLNAQSAGSSQISLTWMASMDDSGMIADHLIQRCQGTGCSAFADIATVPGTVTSYNDALIVAGTTYCYRVQAKDPANNVSPYSNTACATTIGDSTPPMAPGNLRVQ
jgi:chitodextrinase